MSLAGLPEWGAEAVDAAILDMGGECRVRAKVVVGDLLPN